MDLKAFGAIEDLGLSMFWSLGQTGLRTVGTKGPFETLVHIVFMGFSTFGVLCTFTMLYYSIICHRPTISYNAIQSVLLPIQLIGTI